MTHDLHLRKVAQADLPVFFEHQRDPDSTRMAAFPARDRDAFLAHWAKILADATVITRAIAFEGQVAGNVVCWEHEEERDIGYWIGREFWGRGIATLALAEFLRQVQVRPLHAHVAKHNLASIRVLEKCGFARCGEGDGISVPGEGTVGEYILMLGGPPEAIEGAETLP